MGRLSPYLSQVPAAAKLFHPRRAAAGRTMKDRGTVDAEGTRAVRHARAANIAELPKVPPP